jgi:hypothetical protein
MVSKSALIVAVGLVSTLSVGAGTYLAFRANQTATPGVEASSPTSPSVRAPELQSPSPSSPAAAPAAQPDSVARQDAPAPRAPRRAPSAAANVPSRAPVPQEPSAPPAVVAPVTSPVVEPPPPATGTVTPVVETPVPVEPPKPRFEDVVVKEDSVIGIRIDQAVSSDTARVEDRVTAKIVRDVTVDGRTALAAGTRLEGFVTVVERGGKMRTRSRLGIKFNMLILADGLRVPIQTEAILREGESPSSEATSKIGAGAVAGAIVGGLLGGKRGAVVGSTVGAAGGTAAVMTSGRNEVAIASGAPLTVRLTAPVTITIERDPQIR